MSTHDCITFGTRMGPRFRPALALAALLLVASAAWASSSTVNECLEGADFIANAAAARDNGMTRDAFLGKLDGDLLLIQAFPAELRWFAKDADDAQFLRFAAQQVFDHPESRERHRARFLDACFARVSL
jgi:hypothetical protein